jgi:protein-disulfide isomerase
MEHHTYPHHHTEKAEEKEPQGKISTPQAIIVAGVLVMVALLISQGKPVDPKSSTKTLSEQVGVSKDALTACIKDTDMDARNNVIQASVKEAMKGLPDDQRGTPYTIIIGKNGVKTEVRGADSYENVKKQVDDAANGIVATQYTGNVALSEPTDHVKGASTATVTMIEYSDFECPFCKRFHPTLEKIVAESNGNVRWIYRHWPLHQHSFERLIAADCVAKLKGDDAFFKYADLLFGLLKTEEPDTTSAQL